MITHHSLLKKRGTEEEVGNYIVFSSSSSFTITSYDTTSGTTVAHYWNGVVQYSQDSITWTNWDGNTVSSGSSNKLYFRGTGNTLLSSTTGSQLARWSISGTSVSCEGNIENLLDYMAVKNGSHPSMLKQCFRAMFYGCDSLISAPSLESTSLSVSCYLNMFYNCTGLRSAPLLPATIMAISCYSNMFYGCSSLTTAPVLNSTTLADSCYNGMFYGCSSLTSAPALPATTLQNYCYSSMFYGCSSLTSAPTLPATTAKTNCYYQMFRNCTSLVSAPSLPATSLANYCYYYMFAGCSSLEAIPALLATTMANYCYQFLFYGCTKLKFSETQSGEYINAYRIPTSGTGISATSWNTNMFVRTSGTFTGNPSLDTTYYTNATIV